ncbi:hypothetical protein D187_005235 [Cystobacter fuscus DSM 2262]|uniref:DUF2589 domain-containing protein n=1 Tax=Cystobacter fuscus (strain ATCC 25194 / DSM 2262 / NBRC 100088 / M29) TaxID=1242864 RepID=S9PNT6_CYSF2|nr:DUF2589 domain-containing protein [Cystobacter fuscus]EPX64102.1 hypothetical protein D187_005235 [Cystobacter fuscus DSM 2262]
MDQASSALQGIPFENLIGGPLTAAVKAQALAAKTSVDFIRSVGFTEKNEVVNIKFVYQRDGRNVSLDVPLLTIVPIPYLRIDDMTINFKATLSASGDSNTISTDNFEAKTEASASGGFWGQSYSLSGSVSSKKDSTASASSKYSIEYTMDINVHAVQDDIPKGLSTVLGLLGEQMKPVPQAVSQTSIQATWDKIYPALSPKKGQPVSIKDADVALTDSEKKPVPGVAVTFDLLGNDGKLLASVQGKSNNQGNLESDLILTVPTEFQGEAQWRMSIDGRTKQAKVTVS